MSKYVGNVNNFTLDGVVIDNFLFGVSSVGKNGKESVVVFPSEVTEFLSLYLDLNNF